MKNQKLLDKALGCLPSLYETKVDAVRTVELEKNGEKTEIKETENRIKK